MSHESEYPDLAALGRSQYFAEVVRDHAVATSVARHKSFCFIEKDSAGNIINSLSAISGRMNIVPKDKALAALAKDNANMLADQVMLGDALTLVQLIYACREIEIQANLAALP